MTFMSYKIVNLFPHNLKLSFFYLRCQTLEICIETFRFICTLTASEENVPMYDTSVRLLFYSA